MVRRSRRRATHSPLLRLGQFGLALYALGGAALYWHEATVQRALLQDKQRELAAVTRQVEHTKNHVTLLQQPEPDADYLTEIMRRNFNVIHPGEHVVPPQMN